MKATDVKEPGYYWWEMEPGIRFMVECLVHPVDGLLYFESGACVYSPEDMVGDLSEYGSYLVGDPGCYGPDLCKIAEKDEGSYEGQ